MFAYVSTDLAAKSRRPKRRKVVEVVGRVPARSPERHDHAEKFLGQAEDATQERVASARAAAFD